MTSPSHPAPPLFALSRTSRARTLTRVACPAHLRHTIPRGAVRFPPKCSERVAPSRPPSGGAQGSCVKCRHKFSKQKARVLPPPNRGRYKRGRYYSARALSARKAGGANAPRAWHFRALQNDRFCMKTAASLRRCFHTKIQHFV